MNTNKTNRGLKITTGVKAGGLSASNHNRGTIAIR